MTIAPSPHDGLAELNERMRNGRWRPKALKPYGQAENKGGDVRTDAVIRDTIGTFLSRFFLLFDKSGQFNYILNMNEYNWKKYFIPPFHNDDICLDTIWDSDGNRTSSSMSDAAFKGTADEHFKAIVNAMNAIINGTELPKKMSFGHPEYIGSQTESMVKFKANGEAIDLDVRGWGYLIGRKHLDSNMAAAIQDDFGKFIVDCINLINLD